jgi:hypothetical protein
MDEKLRLQLAEEGADAERLTMLTGYLRAELLQLDIDVVAVPQDDGGPPGSRAVGAAGVGTLLITLGRSAEGLRSLPSAVRNWLRRGPEVRLELAGDALELSQASEEDQQRLIELFVNRHAGESRG